MANFDSHLSHWLQFVRRFEFRSNSRPNLVTIQLNPTNDATARRSSVIPTGATGHIASPSPPADVLYIPLITEMQPSSPTPHPSSMQQNQMHMPAITGCLSETATTDPMIPSALEAGSMTCIL
jgi:hypothetical protein